MKLIEYCSVEENIIKSRLLNNDMQIYQKVNKKKHYATLLY